MKDTIKIRNLNKSVWLFGLLVLLLGSCKSELAENKKDEFTIAFGSCSRANEDLSYLQVIADTSKPDIWIWLGDIIYADTEDMSLMREKYDQVKNSTYYQELLKNAKVIGVWDDHDYGKNNSGKNYSKRAESRDELFRFLEVEPGHTPSEGAYQSYLLADDKIKVILLDVRYFRDDPVLNNGRYLPDTTIDMLGEDQWKWLQEELMKVKPDQYVIIGSGIQVIPDEHPYEKWSNFPASRERLFTLLDECRSNQIYLFSGDRHRSEIMTVDLPTKKLIEVTSSGLTHSYNNPDYIEQNSYRQGPQIIKKSYATWTISKGSKNAKICFHSVEDGHSQYCSED